MIKKLILILFLCSLVLGAWGTLEDYTTYTEVDQGSDITVAANTITITGFLSRTQTGYVYKDKGAAHFSGDFTHRLKVNISAIQTNTIAVVWGLSNTVGDEKGWRDASDDSICIRFATAISWERIYLVLDENGSSPSNDYYQGWSTSTDYYLTIDRDDDGGSNSTGLYTLYICTTNYYGEGGAVLVDTLTAQSSAGEQNDFQYCYGLAGYDDNSPSPTVSGTIKDLDLGEASAGGGGGQVIIIEED
jgi:hypothetical protein